MNKKFGMIIGVIMVVAMSVFTIILAPYVTSFECADKDKIAAGLTGYGLSYAVQFTPWYQANCLVKESSLLLNEQVSHNGMIFGTATKYRWQTFEENFYEKHICVRQYFVRYNSYTGISTHYEDRIKSFCVVRDKFNFSALYNRDKYGSVI